MEGIVHLDDPRDVTTNGLCLILSQVSVDLDQLVNAGAIEYVEIPLDSGYLRLQILQLMFNGLGALLVGSGRNFLSTCHVDHLDESTTSPFLVKVTMQLHTKP